SASSSMIRTLMTPGYLSRPGSGVLDRRRHQARRALPAHLRGDLVAHLDTAGAGDVPGELGGAVDRRGDAGPVAGQRDRGAADRGDLAVEHVHQAAAVA